MQLEVLHPHVAYRDCNMCLKYFFEEEGALAGQMRVDKQGRPLERPRGTYPMCKTPGQKCPKGTPENQFTLTERNRKLWDFFKRCKLTGKWPEDEWFLSMSVLLEEVLEDIRQAQQIRLSILSGKR